MPKAGKGTERNEPSQELGSSAGKETEEVDALAEVVLVVGDLLAFLLFGALGRESHGLEVTLATAVGAAYPFALAWLAAGLFLGTLRPERAAQPLDAVKWAWVTWVAAWPAGHFLRSMILQRPVLAAFALVTLGINLLILGLWRAAYAWLAGRLGWVRTAGTSSSAGDG